MFLRLEAQNAVLYVISVSKRAQYSRDTDTTNLLVSGLMVCKLSPQRKLVSFLESQRSDYLATGRSQTGTFRACGTTLQDRKLYIDQHSIAKPPSIKKQSVRFIGQ